MTDIDEINRWMMSEGRELGDGAQIVESYVSRLKAAGVPIARANIAQRFANPLLVAWGVIWTPEGSTEYDVTHATLDTISYIGSPFEYVLTNDRPLHKSLVNLDRDSEHISYLELADGGGTDIFANVLKYGDGSRHGCTYVTNVPEGFTQAQIDIIHATRFGLSAAIEPVTMRRSTESLLRTYIGNDPASAVSNGTIRRGGHQVLEAVVMFTDLRGFTSKSEQWSEQRLLNALNGYFDVVVQAVEENGGDVLKFMGDGVLSIFKVEDATAPDNQCKMAIEAARAAIRGLRELNERRATENEDSLSMGIGINVGPVTYGNIGSPGRLDFTVLGSAVNVASRVQDLCKTLEKPVLATKQVAQHAITAFTSQGHHSIRGVDAPIEVFALNQSP
ncbi:Adenylate cyclase, family 3 (some protein containing HAMP domain) [Hoeflea phototrophica DFL-43]|uniref:Adenylate cyclase, family 3 (Some protein containing HAMP domain) n=1 Tax=Hoeflea phototrophica (strain DSM 17068 / NCIMB 14078 / DFL-43) TaxID=411684 RepID=A9DB44_HOEPD|nr:adenylate/guanylate cyclase domain-containing protein [Hoeflea phototrophica]EDQ32443.1 Adenylate cyclase, family 3 (some protein containing HAMP domain) [Hoeflea phototrophica DFL-43]